MAFESSNATKSALNERLTSEEHDRLRDRSLSWDHVEHPKSIREDIKAAMDQHRPEPLGDYDMAVDFHGRLGHLHEERANGTPENLAKDRHPDPAQREPLTFRQQMKIAMRGHEAMQARGVTPEILKEAGRYQREYREVQAHPEFNKPVPGDARHTRGQFMQLMLRDAMLGNSSVLTRAERHLIGWDAKTGNYSARGLEQVYERRLAKQRG